MPKVAPPSPPYVGPAKFHGGGQSLNPCKRIVIHCTVSPCKPGGARAIASYFKHTVTRPSSAHYVVDPEETVQVVGDHTVAYHAPPNTDSIGVELCDPQAGSASRWGDDNHQKMLKRAARLTAQLCLAYGVPTTHIKSLALRLGRRGVTGHRAVGSAWHQTSHTDPGDGFPWDEFMARVKMEAKQLTSPAEKKKPPPKPKPIPPSKPAGSTSLHFVTSNIKNLPDLSRKQVRHDMTLVKKLGGLIGWQEIAEADDVADLKSCLPNYAHLHTDTECPISVWTDKWVVVDQGKVTLHGGKSQVSPHRVATWVELRRKGKDLAPFVFVNTHFVSGAYSNPGQAAEGWRVESWGKAHDGLSELVQGFLDRGVTCIGGGDFNRTGTWGKFARGQRWLIHGGYDHLWACEAKGGVEVMEAGTGTMGTEKLYTDHAARWAHVYFLAPSLNV